MNGTEHIKPSVVNDKKKYLEKAEIRIQADLVENLALESKAIFQSCRISLIGRTRVSTCN